MEMNIKRQKPWNHQHIQTNSIKAYFNNMSIEQRQIQKTYDYNGEVLSNEVIHHYK